MSTDVTTVTAISADSDMTMSVLVTITEIILKKKKTVSNNLAKFPPRTLCIKRTFSGSSPPRVSRVVRSDVGCRDYKVTFQRKKGCLCSIQGIGSTQNFVSRQR